MAMVQQQLGGDMLIDVTETGRGIANPGLGIANPGFGMANPQLGAANPGAGLANPGAGLANPDAGIANPIASLGEPVDEETGRQKLSRSDSLGQDPDHIEVREALLLLCC